LDYCFASLLWDPLTNPDARLKQIETAKEWFLTHQFPVVSYPKLDQMQFPCITVATQESAENGNTLGDIHETPEIAGDSPTPLVIGPFSAKGYDLVTGTITLPDSLTPIYVSTRMEVVDKTGKVFGIIKSGDGLTVNIPVKSLGDFSKMILRNITPNSITDVESAFFSETFSVGCHTQGDPVFTIYLTSILMFILLRYRETYLEARGFERSTLKVGSLIPLENLVEGKENVFSRYITLNGFVQHVWPKYTWPVVSSMVTSVVVDSADTTPAPLDPSTALWRGVNDPSTYPQ
jgi:hypothetical protein